jgi:hypothetical protein
VSDVWNCLRILQEMFNGQSNAAPINLATDTVLICLPGVPVKRSTPDCFFE